MTTQGYARPELLVETDWLAARLDDPQIRIVDCDPLEVYRRAHIQHAIGIPVHHYIKQPEYTSDFRKYPLVAPPDTMKALMERMGIGDDYLVVTYDSNGCLWSARLWWALHYYGHTNVKVLNGGWKKWFAEGRPVSIDSPRPAAATFTPRPILTCSARWTMGGQTLAMQRWCSLTCVPMANGTAPTTAATNGPAGFLVQCIWNGSILSLPTRIRRSNRPMSSAPCWRRSAPRPTKTSSRIDKEASVRRTDSSFCNSWGIQERAITTAPWASGPTVMTPRWWSSGTRRPGAVA